MCALLLTDSYISVNNRIGYYDFELCEIPISYGKFFFFYNNSKFFLIQFKRNKIKFIYCIKKIKKNKCIRKKNFLNINF